MKGSKIGATLGNDQRSTGIKLEYYNEP